MLLTVQEFAKSLCVDSSTVRRWIRAGVLKHKKMPSIGKRAMYRIDDVELHNILKTSE